MDWKFSQKTVARFVLCGAILTAVAACGTYYRPGDELRSCADLQSEIAENDARAAVLLPATDSSATGDEPLRPYGTFAGMSFALAKPGDAERTKVKTLHRRNGLLLDYASNKGC